MHSYKDSIHHVFLYMNVATLLKVADTEDSPTTIKGSGDASKIKLRGRDGDDWRVFHVRHDRYIIEVQHCSTEFNQRV